MSILSLLEPDHAFVPLAMVVSTIGVVSLGSSVMAARKKFNVPYPNMYAVCLKDANGKPVSTCANPEDVDKFNCVQRGHQNALESHYSMLMLTAIGGILFPRAASAGLLSWTFGAVMYSKNYSNRGADKRNGGLALFKYLGLLTLLCLNLATSYQIYTK